MGSEISKKLGSCVWRIWYGCMEVRKDRNCECICSCTVLCFYTLVMEVTASCNTSVCIYQGTQCHIPEEPNNSQNLHLPYIMQVEKEYCTGFWWGNKTDHLEDISTDGSWMSMEGGSGFGGQFLGSCECSDELLSSIKFVAGRELLTAWGLSWCGGEEIGQRFVVSTWCFVMLCLSPSFGKSHNVCACHCRCVRSRGEGHSTGTAECELWAVLCYCGWVQMLWKWGSQTMGVSPSQNHSPSTDYCLPPHKNSRYFYC